MKRVSSKVAKAIKEAGYPIEVKSIEEAEKLGWQGNAFFTGTCTCGLCPYAIEVWLWLWREKGIYIDIAHYYSSDEVTIWDKKYNKLKSIDCEGKYSDPEDAIVVAIKYLVDNDLIE